VLLDLRRRRRATFDDAPSVPVSVRGRHASHLVAFARPHREGTVVVIAPRHTYALAGAGTWAVGEAWADTSIPLDPEWSGPFTNVVNGASVVPRRGALRVRDVLATVPVGVLSAP
jgi:(1->4)-alpha-D-glucan 1-alpha-D-glucosylmutase